jgi:hypothetical protein
VGPLKKLQVKMKGVWGNEELRKTWVSFGHSGIKPWWSTHHGVLKQTKA